MHPEILRIGPVTLYSYGLMIGLGFVAGVMVASYRARQKGIDPDSLFWLFIALLVGGVVGGRLFYIVLNPQYFSSLASVFDTRDGGLAIHGVLIGGIVALAAYSRFRTVRFVDLADLVSPSVALGQSLGRIGCFLAGCCYGIETGGSWGFATRFAPGLRHPYQLYESAADFILFLGLLRVSSRMKVKGGVFLSYGFGYSLIRFFLEFLRDNDTHVLGLSYGQWGSLAAALVAAGVFAFLSAHQTEKVSVEQGQN